MKKIIFTVTNDLSYDQRMIRICQTLSDTGFDVTLTGRVLPASVPLSQRNFKQTRIKCLFNKGKLFYLEYNLRLFFFLLNKPAGIIGSVDTDTLLPGYLVSKIKKLPQVFDAHEYYTEVPELADRPFAKKIWKALEKWIVPKLKYCYTVNESIAKIYEREYKVPFQVIRNVPYYRETKTTETRHDEKFLFYQGALNMGRGLETLISAIKDLPLKLYLAGEGDLSLQLRALVQQNQLEEKVFFLGKLLPEQLDQVTEQAFAGLNLLENKGLNYYYSLANKFFDYIQSGIPQICMNFPEYIRINEEYQVALLIDDVKTETITGSVNQLLNDYQLYQTLRQNAIKAKQLYNWEKEQKKLIDIFEAI